jgi:D-alanine-D-alanine ligase
MDKVFTKQIVRTTGIRQAECVILYRELWDTSSDNRISEAEAKFGYPMFVKPARAGSSVGVSKVRDRSEFLRAAEIAFRADSKVLVEEAIDGREIEVAVLNEGTAYTVSDCAEIVTGADFYDYEAKYQSSASGYHIPARLPEDVRQQVRRFAEMIFRALDCRGLSRVDFFVNDRGDIVFNEINTLPGFTDISMYPKLMMHTGMTYAELIDRLVASAM